MLLAVHGLRAGHDWFGFNVVLVFAPHAVHLRRGGPMLALWCAHRWCRCSRRMTSAARLRRQQPLHQHVQRTGRFESGTVAQISAGDGPQPLLPAGDFRRVRRLGTVMVVGAGGVDLAQIRRYGRLDATWTRAQGGLFSAHERILIWFLVLSFLAAARAQDDATQQQINKLSGQIQEALDAQAVQAKTHHRAGKGNQRSA